MQNRTSDFFKLHTFSPWCLVYNLYVLTLDTLVIVARNYPVLHVVLLAENPIGKRSIWQQQTKGKGMRESQLLWYRVLSWNEDLSTAEDLSLLSSVEEGHWKKPMCCISLPVDCNIVVTWLVKCYIQKQQFRKASCHCVWYSVCSKEILWVWWLTLTGFFPHAMGPSLAA